MTITITAFEHSPDGGQGMARDMRVRWALEEVGVAYKVRPLSFEAMKRPDHLARQPFGQIPTFEEGSLTLFETGAIVLHLGQTRAGLLPEDTAGRARGITWIFAALNSVEPPILEREMALILERDEAWFDARLPMLEDNIRKRLEALETWLGDADWLEGEFGAGDLMMISVLLRLKGEALLDAYPTLADYVARGEARPAYHRAFAAQLALFRAGEERGG